MRFFTNGHTVIRLHTDAKGVDQIDTAKAETWQFRTGTWAEKPNLTSKIAFTGDWEPCSEDDAYAVLQHSSTAISHPAD